MNLDLPRRYPSLELRRILDEILDALFNLRHQLTLCRCRYASPHCTHSVNS